MHTYYSTLPSKSSDNKLLPYYDLACELDKIPKTDTVKSLYNYWSEYENWTGKQVGYVQYLLREAGKKILLPAPITSMHNPFPRSRNRHLQALRGVKSGEVRRYQTRTRDFRILEMSKNGTKQKVIADYFCISTRHVRYILRRFRDGVRIARRTIMPTDSYRIKDVLGFLKEGEDRIRTVKKIQGHRKFLLPIPLENIDGAAPRILKSLCKWVVLDVCAGVSEVDVMKAAEYLNGNDATGVSPKRLAGIVRSVMKFKAHKCFVNAY